MSVHMKAVVRTVIILGFLAVGAGGFAQAQTKIGFVNVEKIIGQLPEIKEIDQKLNTVAQSFQDTLKAIEANYKAKLEAYQRQQGMMTPEAKAKEEEALRAMETQYTQYQQDRLGQKGVLAQMQAQMMQPIREKVRTAIEKIAKDEKLSGVMDESTFLYVDTKLDITFKVLDFMRRGN